MQGFTFEEYAGMQMWLHLFKRKMVNKNSFVFPTVFSPFAPTFPLYPNHVSVLCHYLSVYLFYVSVFCYLSFDQSKSSVALCSRDECVQRLASLWEKTQLKGAHSFPMAMTQHTTPHRKVLDYSVCVCVCACMLLPPICLQQRG